MPSCNGVSVYDSKFCNIMGDFLSTPLTVWTKMCVTLLCLHLQVEGMGTYHVGPIKIRNYFIIYVVFVSIHTRLLRIQ